MKSRVLITNGDHAAHALAAHFPDAEILIWRDVLVEGPVPGDIDNETLADIRAKYIEDAFGMRDVRADFLRRNRAFEQIAGSQPIELWFETDLHDQLQIIELLARLSASNRDAAAFLALCSPPLSSHIEEATHKLREITPAEHQAGAALWAAFRSKSPEEIQKLVKTPGVLPEARTALARLLEEYPSPQDGLGRIERAALNAIRDGAITPGLAFRHYQQTEALPFLGDLGFFHRLDALANSSTPLVHGLPHGGIAQATLTNMAVEYTDTLIEITDAGRDTLEKREDFVTLNGIDRWIGGVHLTSENIWRFDAQSGTLSR